MTPSATGWRRLLLLTAGNLSVGLAIAGIFLPLLPTTPFLLLASYCFLRSSPACYDQLMKHRLAGPFLKDWQRHQAVRPAVKRTAIVTVLGVMCLTLWLSRSVWIIQVLTLTCCVIGLVVIARLPVIRTDSEDGAREPECPHSESAGHDGGDASRSQ